jgi:hypothetical protein
MSRLLSSGQHLSARALVMAALAFCLAGCAAATSHATGSTLREQAAKEATAIVERAEATALVLRAEATARALTHVETQTPPAMTDATLPQPSLSAQAIPARPTEQVPAPSSEAGQESLAVEVVSIQVASQSGFLVLQYKADPTFVGKLSPTQFYLRDEATGTEYRDIPTLPSMGLMFGRPQRAGQIATVLFSNVGNLQPGATMTVVIGSIKHEHVVLR